VHFRLVPERHPPAPIAAVSAGVAFGVVESVKAVSDLLSPISGEVIEANTPVTDDPSVINASPYGDGWLMKVKIDASP
jgi:glycine cleavage system H protein